MPRRKSGFTLIELLIYSGIVVVVVTLIVGVVYSIFSFSLRNRARQEVFQNARFFAELLSRDLEEADACLSCDVEGGADSTLVLQKGATEITYTLGEEEEDENRIVRTEGENIDFVTSNQVAISNLIFLTGERASADAPVILQVSFQCRYVGSIYGRQTISETFQFAKIVD